MKNSKKTLVTTATSEIFIIRRGAVQKTIRAFCPNCQIQTEMLELNSAVTAFRIGARRLIGQIEIGAIHSTETANGYLLICEKSLRQTTSDAENKIKRGHFEI
jgi:hypothetical protein